MSQDIKIDHVAYAASIERAKFLWAGSPLDKFDMSLKQAVVQAVARGLRQKVFQESEIENFLAQLNKSFGINYALEVYINTKHKQECNLLTLDKIAWVLRLNGLHADDITDAIRRLAKAKTERTWENIKRDMMIAEMEKHA